LNTDTGAFYEGLADILAAKARGEPLAELGAEAAHVVRAGHAALQREQRQATRKIRRKMAKQSRRRNRR
jgi:hypothetical protein